MTLDIKFKKQKPNRSIPINELTAEEEKRCEILNDSAKFIAKNFLFSSAGIFHSLFPEKNDVLFVIKILDNNLFYLQTLEISDFHPLIEYKPLQISDPYEIWNRVGEYAEKLGINEYDVLDYDDIRIFSINFTSKEYLEAYKSCPES